jgi:hypothetical protein
MTQSVVWNGIEREPAAIEVWYRFLRSSRGAFLDIKIDYPTADRNTEEPGWSVQVNLSSDRIKVGEEVPDAAEALFMGVSMRVVLFADDFVPPGGAFDADVLSEPGTRTNVQNGFGYLGSIGRFDVEWVLDDETIAALGYIAPKR